MSNHDLGAEVYQEDSHIEVIDVARGIWLMWDRKIDHRGIWGTTLGLVKGQCGSCHRPRWDVRELLLSVN